MKVTNSISKLALLIVGAASSAIVVAEQLPEITVQGSRLVRTDVPSQNPGYPPAQITQLSRTVGYADIDVSTVSGAKELEKRVAATARFVCNELDGLTVSRDEACFKRTVDTAKGQIEAAIRYAELARTAAR